ncbi:MAG: hypothetical protein R3C61_06455 [Bacteroidia bacterium]
MRNISLFVLILILGYGQVWGCEVCGCAATGSMIGIMPQFKGNFISLGWRYSRFYASENLDNGTDYFHQAEARLGLRVHPRLQVQVVMPYSINTHTAPTEKNSSHGPGDTWVMGDFTVLRSADTSARMFRHYFAAGAGIKIPTGKFDPENQKNPMPANFQMGSGSWDFLTHMFYNVRFRSWSLSADLTGRLNTVNADEYLFGNQLAGTTYISYLLRSPSVNIMPFGGIYYEKLGRNVSESVYQYGTGGSGTYAMVGTELQTDHWGARISYTPHLASHYAGGEISGGDRINVNLSFIF